VKSDGGSERCRGEAGLTLIELLIVMVILPIVIGAAGTALITSFRNSNSVQSRISQSHDSQITSTYFVRDVQSSTMITTSSSPICGPAATQVLGVEWPGPSAQGTVAVSYVTTTIGTPPSPVLQRWYCPNAAEPTAFTTTTLAHDLGSGSASVVVSCSTYDARCSTDAGASAGVSALDISSVELDVTDELPPSGGTGFVEAVSPFPFSLTAVPRIFEAASAGSMVDAIPPLELLGTGTGACSSSITVNGVAALNTGALQFGGGTLTATGVYAATQNPNPVLPASAYSGEPITGPALTNPFQNLPEPAITGTTGPYGPIYQYTHGAWSPPLPGSWPAGVIPTFVFDNSHGPGTGPLIDTDIANHSLYSGIYVFTDGIGSGGVGNLSSDPGGVFLDDLGFDPISVGGTNALDLSALSLTPYAGIALLAPNVGATSEGYVTMTGNGAATVLDGAVVAPNANVTLKGAGDMDVLALIASQLSCTGAGNGVFGPKPSRVSLVPSEDPSRNGDTVTFTATVTPMIGGGTPTGTVTFLETPSGSSQTALCPAVALVGGSASCATNVLASSGAPYTIVAEYLSDNGADQNENSDPLTQYVPWETETSVANRSPGPIVSGQDVTFVATVTTSGGPSPIGNVMFQATSAGGTTKTLCTNQVVTNGTAKCKRDSLIAAGSLYSITASFIPTDPNVFLPSVSGSITQEVDRAATSTTLVSSLNPSAIGLPVIYTATVSITPPGDGDLHGNVTFSDGLTPITCQFGSHAFNGTTATCVVTYNDLSGNPHDISALYSGDANYEGSSSPVLTQVEDPLPTITGPTSADPYIGHTGTQTITVTGTNFQNGVTATASPPFTVTNVTYVDPDHVTVTLTDSGGGGTADLTITNPDKGAVTSPNSLVDG
jgi:prepilin-type N-terminal cleavage/methylation domain-containing protein